MLLTGVREVGSTARGIILPIIYIYCALLVDLLLDYVKCIGFFGGLYKDFTEFWAFLGVLARIQARKGSRDKEVALWSKVKC